MPADYAILAPIYDTAGLSNLANTMTPQLLRLVLQRDWMGRSILDLGCGTGVGIAWLKQQTYRAGGVDNSPDMLQVARQNVGDTRSTPLYEQDIRRLEIPDEYDLVLALDVLNELDSLRDLEATFRGAHKALRAGQLFVFDLHTLEGLTTRNTEGIFYDSQDSLTIFTRSEYDYERQMRTIHYLLFVHGADGVWSRQQAQQVQRGYPIQAIVTLLTRTGFELVSVLTPSFAVYEPNTAAGVERVYIIAKKP